MSRKILCHNQLESGNHLFSSCQATRTVWQTLQVKLHIIVPTGAITNWLWTQPKENLKVVTWTWWYLWKARNATIFQSQPLHPASILGKILQALHEWNVARTLFPNWKPSPLLLETWSAPPLTTHKLNIDGSFNPSSGTGGIGEIISSFRPSHLLPWPTLLLKLECKPFSEAYNYV